MKNQPMQSRIAYLGIKGLPSKSGTERVIEAIISRMVGKYDITVYCGADYTPPETQYNGIRLIRIPTLRGKHLKPISLVFFSAFHALLFGHYDLIHMNGIENCIVLPLMKLRFRIVSTSHGTPWRLKVTKWSQFDLFYMEMMEYPFLYLSDCPTTISMVDTEHFYNRYRKEVTFIPNGVDYDLQIDRKAALRFIEEQGLTPNNFLLFIAGRIIERKGCHLLLEATNTLNLDMPIVIIGDMEQIPAYSQKLKDLARNRQVLFIPPIADKSLLFGIMDLCKVFVFPSTAEGMSMVLLEAASLGIPMVCSDIPENKIVLGENVTYFRSQDQNDLADKILWVLKNPDEAKGIAQVLKSWVKENYSWESIASQYELIYQRYIR